MDNSRTGIDELIHYAKTTKREIVYKESPYPISSYRQIPRYKDVVYMPYSINGASFFVWSSDPYHENGGLSTFSGAFIPISSKIKSKLNIRNSNILDKVNLFTKHKKHNYLSEKFNSKTVITGDENSDLIDILNPMIQNKLLEALKVSPLIRISINELNIDFVPSLKGCSYLSIINPQGWFYTPEEIDKLFEIIEDVNKILNPPR